MHNIGSAQYLHAAATAGARRGGMDRSRRSGSGRASGSASPAHAAALATARHQLLSVAAGGLGRGAGGSARARAVDDRRTPHAGRTRRALRPSARGACRLCLRRARRDAKGLEKVAEDLEVLAEQQGALRGLGEPEGALDRRNDERGDLACVDIAANGAFSASALERLSERLDPLSNTTTTRRRKRSSSGDISCARLLSGHPSSTISARPGSQNSAATTSSTSSIPEMGSPS